MLALGEAEAEAEGMELPPSKRSKIEGAQDAGAAGPALGATLGKRWSAATSGTTREITLLNDSESASGAGEGGGGGGGGGGVGVRHWLPNNPTGVPTEREDFCEKNGKPCSRALFVRNATPPQATADRTAEAESAVVGEEEGEEGDEGEEGERGGKRKA